MPNGLFWVASIYWNPINSIKAPENQRSRYFRNSSGISICQKFRIQTQSIRKFRLWNLEISNFLAFLHRISEFPCPEFFRSFGGVSGGYSFRGISEILREFHQKFWNSSSEVQNPEFLSRNSEISKFPSWELPKFPNFRVGNFPKYQNFRSIKVHVYRIQ